MKLASITAIIFGLLGSSTTPHKYSSEIGKIFGHGSRMDVHEVFILTNLLLDTVLEDRMHDLLPHIDSDTGVYVDVKALWTKEQFYNDLNDSNGYLAKFFISTRKLRKYKESEEALASSDELRKSSLYRMDFFFEEEDCHVQIHFLEDSDSQSNINNPVFRKIRGKWYYLRLL